MVRAYVMVKTHTGEAERLRDEIRAIDGVVDAPIVAGDVDFIVTVEVETTADVKGIAAREIQSLQGVEHTQTYMVMD